MPARGALPAHPSGEAAKRSTPPRESGMAIGTLAKKELRLLLRDRMAAILLLGMPLIFILVLGLLLGEGFGQKPDDRLRFSLVDEDLGLAPVAVAGAWGLAATPGE